MREYWASPSAANRPEAWENMPCWLARPRSPPATVAKEPEAVLTNPPPTVAVVPEAVLLFPPVTVVRVPEAVLFCPPPTVL
jgi:hypothetical protein